MGAWFIWVASTSTASPQIEYRPYDSTMSPHTRLKARVTLSVEEKILNGKRVIIICFRGRRGGGEFKPTSSSRLIRQADVHLRLRNRLETAEL